MSEYRHGTHSVFRLHVHLVWCTKYRRAVLRGEIGYRFRDLVRQMCSDMGVEILKGAVAKEHVHLLVSMPPQLSVSKLVQKLKGKTSYKLQREYRSLQKAYWGQRMWARGYFACSTGNVTDEMIAAYIERHGETEEQFKVVDPGDFESS
ncbi:MAG TPA: IS200/IS605 family transposase [Gammaproteobacteria bacterium]|nr:IS200/IS605 family transposase [Gammaproteobacteria bacterium]